jgi:hypothetical protein
LIKSGITAVLCKGKLWPVNDVTEVSTQEATIALVLPRKFAYVFGWNSRPLQLCSNFLGSTHLGSTQSWVHPISKVHYVLFSTDREFKIGLA